MRSLRTPILPLLLGLGPGVRYCVCKVREETLHTHYLSTCLLSVLLPALQSLMYTWTETVLCICRIIRTCRVSQNWNTLRSTTLNPKVMGVRQDIFRETPSSVPQDREPLTQQGQTHRFNEKIRVQGWHWGLRFKVTVSVQGLKA